MIALLTVYKYPLRDLERQTIEIPGLEEGGFLVKFSRQVVKVDVQNGIPCLWVMVDTDRSPRPVRITMLGTGEYLPEDLRRYEYLGTLLLENGNLVYHVFGRGIG